MTDIDHCVLGWDIGGANVKAVRLECRGHKIKAHRAAVRPFEIWRQPGDLIIVLQDIAAELGMQGHQNMAVTMTAELSDVFRTKREGVLFVLAAIEKAFSKIPVYPFNLKGKFFTLAEARKRPLMCAATNWLADRTFHRSSSSRLHSDGYRQYDHRHHSHKGRKSGQQRSHRHTAAGIRRIGLYRPLANKPEYCGQSGPGSGPTLPRCGRVFYLHGGYLSSFGSNSPGSIHLSHCRRQAQNHTCGPESTGPAGLFRQ